MKHLRLILMCCLGLITQLSFSQDKEVRGKVTDDAGAGLPSVSVTLKGKGTGTSTAADGTFRMMAPGAGTLVFTGVGLGTIEQNIQGRSYLEVKLLRTTSNLDEVVVTALGIRKNRNQVSYAAQTVTGEEVSKTRTANFMNNLSGKVSGLELRQTNTLGGSTNVILRGTKSITGNNQALFVVDGIPFDNSNNNSGGQRTGRGGYDYGNAAADVNPDDIASITVLKGAAASALYGSRGSNGVILITTKKGTRGLGVTVNSGVSVGAIDKSTFAKYQKEYGGGYG
ncbi:MAG: TonB-dependent receptor plug domain-containing protein, partial [Chitinophagaceae bacterium]|nr:TonB-dependent receptor plug domain-containing protein [Chitinophagaceae bacterium]